MEAIVLMESDEGAIENVGMREEMERWRIPQVFKQFGEGESGIDGEAGR